MKEILIRLICAFIGSYGFSLLFGLRKRHLLLASLGGLLSFAVCLGVDALAHNAFFATLLASVFAVFYAEVLARLRKCPATLFVIPAIIPLVPGGSLYYTMSNAIRGDLPEAVTYGRQTLLAALAIAAGLSFVETLWQLAAKKEGR